MSTIKGTYLTKEGLGKLQEELQQLKSVKRREIADRIQQAKELGDLSENAEYVEAKNEQGFVEGRILELENTLRNAIVIQESGSSEIVSVGSVITAKVDGKSFTYTIVGSSESDPANGKISNESPLGSGFLGKKIGEKIDVPTPRGVISYTIVSIQ